jgi:hypothetical protein
MGRPLVMDMRIELCWGCHDALGDDAVKARSQTARALDMGWHRWHRWCVPDGYELYEPTGGRW